MNKKPQSDKKASGGVQSLSRAVSILRFISSQPQGVRFGDIPPSVDLPPSTVHRLLASLEYERLLRSDAITGLWFIGIDAFTIGNGFLQSKNVLQFSQSHLKNLVHKYSETASIYLENEGEMVCMDQYESHNMIRSITRVGGRVKMHCSGAGKAVLAYWDDEDVTEIIRIHKMEQVTEKTISSLSTLRADLVKIRKTGYSFDDEEVALGVRCVAAPIFDHQNRSIAAVSVSGPVMRMKQDKIRAISIGVMETAAQLSNEVGAHLQG